MANTVSVIEKPIPEKVSKDAYVLGIQDNGSGGQALYRLPLGEVRANGANDLFIIPALIAQYGTKQALTVFINANIEYDNLTAIVDRFFKAAASAVTETYGTQFYRYNTSNSPLGTKIGDNAGLTCTPSTIAVPGTDDYADLPLFACFDINYIIDSVSLEPVIIAIKDVYGAFTSTPTESLVGVLQMTGWVRRTGDETTKTVEYRAQQANGFKPLPEGVKVDGSVRGFVIHAKYAAGYDANGLLSSVAGVQPATLRSGSEGSTSISHDGQIAKWRARGNQYSGAALCDHAFLQLMLEIKYADLGNAAVMAGCRNYSSAYAAAVSETGVNRIVLTASQGNYFVVGSRVSIGTSNDRAKATCYDVHDIATISRIEDVTIDGTTYKAVYIDTENIFDVAASTTYITPQPWATGSTDNVPGNDGSPTNNTSGKEPFKIQGIEVMLGMYEVPGGVKLYEDTEKYTVYATRLAASIVSGSTVNDDYFILGTIPKEEAAAWKYNAELNWDANDQEAYMLGQQFGGSSTTGYRSATYRDAAATVGWREWPAFGRLVGGGSCGLACAYLVYGLGSAYWGIGARSSGTSGNRGEYTAAQAAV